MKVVFITYLNRSGSTFLVNQLSKNPDILVLPEAEILVKKLLYDPLGVPDSRTLNELLSDHKLKNWIWETSELPHIENGDTNAILFFKLLKTYRSFHNPEAKVVVFKAWELIFALKKMPEHLIKQYNIRNLVLIRDARAIFASQRNNLYKNRVLENNSIRTALKWKMLIRFCNENKSLIQHFKYENMIENYSNFFRNLYEYLGLEWNESFRIVNGKLSDQLPEDQKHLHPDIDLDPIKENTSKWKTSLPIVEIDIIQRFASAELILFGYSLIPLRSPVLKLYSTMIKNLAGYILIR